MSSHGTILTKKLEGWLGADAPPLRAGRLPWLPYAWGLLSVVICTVLDKLMVGRIAEANLIMVYLFGILPVSLRGNPGAAIGTAILSVAAFDFFLVPPYYTFAVSDTQYLFTFLVMGSVGLVISALTARLAAGISETLQRERRARALYELSRSLLAAMEPADILAQGAQVIGRELDQRVGAWLRGPDGEPVAIESAAMPLSTSEREVVRWTLRSGRSAGRMTASLPGSQVMVVPISGKTSVHGALALRFAPEKKAERGPDLRETLETGANQMAIALEQARARHEAEEARRKAEAESLRSSLLSSVSHDLRTPLAGIVGAASSLNLSGEAMTAEERHELSGGILEEAQRLNRLVNNLLQATRLEEGGLRIAHDWLPFDEIVAPAISRVERELADHPLTVDVPADLPLVVGDPTLLEQVLINLLENAARHTEPGTSVTLRAWADMARVWVEVADCGKGFPPGEEERVFEKFHCHPGPAGALGTGLGLAICRGIVTAHGGAIVARNQPEGGVVFRFWLPIATTTPSEPGIAG